VTSNKPVAEQKSIAVDLTAGEFIPRHRQQIAFTVFIERVIFNFVHAPCRDNKGGDYVVAAESGRRPLQRPLYSSGNSRQIEECTRPGPERVADGPTGSRRRQKPFAPG